MATPPTPPWEILPTKALEAIFHHLGVVQLAQVRLMCRHWNAAVCHSPALMDKLVPTFSVKKSVFPQEDNAKKQQEMVDLLSGRFRKVCIDETNVTRAAYHPLWAKLGQTVQHLVVSGGFQGNIVVVDLLELLRNVPSLVRLEIKVGLVGHSNFSYADIEFKLEKLEELIIFYDDDGRWLRLLKGICSKLKVVKHWNRYAENEVTQVILAHQQTLQEIALNGTRFDVKFLKEFRLPQLKNITFELNTYGVTEKENFVQLFKAFPALEGLNLDSGIKLDTELLEDLQANLGPSFGQLRTLNISTWHGTDCNALKMLLSKMPQLEHLGICMINCNLNLQGISCQNLKTLNLIDFECTMEGLADFFRASPKIKVLNLRYFKVTSNKILLETLSRLKSLETLDIYAEEFSQSDLCDVKLCSLRTLRSCSVRLATCCVNLEFIHLEYVAINDEHVFDLLCRLPKLRRLVIIPENVQNELTDAALDFLATEGRRLDVLKLKLMATKTSQAALDRLVEALKNIVVFRFFLEDWRRQRKYYEPGWFDGYFDE